jgi:carboxymethylenebutenolidase
MNTVLLSLLLSTPVAIAGTRAAALHEPAGAGPFPAVLLIEGWWMPQPWDETTAERLAQDGYLVLRVLPDRGERPADRDAMHALMTGPPNAKTLAGLRASREWLLAREDVRGGRIAVVGARMGGRDALAIADEPGVAAAVSWYGVSPPTAPRVPALALFGGQDMGPSLADARRFEAAAKGTAAEVRIYPEAQHGFADPKNPWGGYDAKAAEDSWARAIAFLDARLDAPTSAVVSPEGARAAAGDAASRAAVDCVMAAWNAYDTDSSRRCYAASPVARNAHGVVPIDWDFERGLRGFDRVARSKFTADIVRVDRASVEYRLRETNDFLAALGLDGVTAIWRYTLEGGLIAEEELLDSDASFRTRLRKFTGWGTTEKPPGWESVLDSEGTVRFDGTTAPTLIRLAREWSNPKG